MKKTKYSDSQILSILKKHEMGNPVANICRDYKISSATFYKWRSKYNGMTLSLMQRMKDLEKENNQLKKMYAEEKLKYELVQEVLEKKF